MYPILHLLAFLNSQQGAVHKMPSAQNRKKIDPYPLVRKMSALAQQPPPLSVRTHHKFRRIRSFLHQKVWTSASEESPSPLTANAFYARPQLNFLFFFRKLYKLNILLKVNVRIMTTTVKGEAATVGGEEEVGTMMDISNGMGVIEVSEAAAVTAITEAKITDTIADMVVAEAAGTEITEEIDILHKSKNSKNQHQVTSFYQGLYVPTTNVDQN